MDRFSTLTVFRRVVELSGFSAAARDLRLSNAAVSKAVKELESELGVQLIVRTTRASHLTEVGRAYYQRVCPLLDDLAGADEWVRAASETPRGRLRVSAPMSFGLVALSQALPGFAQRHPELQIDLHLSDACVDLVEDGFDLAIRGGRLGDSSLRARKLMDFERVVCAAPKYLARRGRPVAPEELSDHACLLFTGSLSPEVWRLQSGEHTRTVSVQSSYRVNNSLALRDAALQGAGLALLPRVYVREELAQGQLECALVGWKGEAQAMYAVYPAHHQESLKLRVFLEFLGELFAPPLMPHD